MTTKSSVAVKNLLFYFNKHEAPFLNDITIAFRPNRLNFIYGSNGVGKSTLLRVIRGTIEQGERAQGTVCIGTHTYDINDTRALSDQIAMVPQQFEALLIDTYSFRENLQLALINRFPGLQPLPQAKPIPDFIEKYGINYDVPIALLSGGQRQILSILMLLQRSPHIIFLDEPTAALDETNTQLIMDFLLELCTQKEITIVLILHNKEIIDRYCNGTYFAFKKDKNGNRTITPTQPDAP